VSNTIDDLINETYSYLYAGSRDPLNKLTTTLDTDDTAVVLTYELGSARAGSVLSIGLELLYVWEVANEQSQVLTVERGYLGTTAAAHTAGAMVTINPKFPAVAVFNAINADLDDLSANGLFQVLTTTLTYSAAVQGYDLGSNLEVLEILQVKYDEPGPAQLWPEIKSYKLRRASDTSDFGTGKAIVLYESGNPGTDLRVTLARPFVRFTALGQFISTQSGLPVTAYDIPPLGAAYRLQSVREGQRNFNESQPATRRADEVGAGAQLQAARGLQQLRRDRIRVEAARIRKLWPNRRRMPAS
jgi:hypothetical protein